MKTLKSLLARFFPGALETETPKTQISKDFQIRDLDLEISKIPSNVLAYAWLIALSAGNAYYDKISEIRNNLEKRLNREQVRDGQRLAAKIRAHIVAKGALDSLPARTHYWVERFVQKNRRNRDLLRSLETALTGDQIRESRKYRNSQRSWRQGNHALPAA